MLPRLSDFSRSLATPSEGIPTRCHQKSESAFIKYHVIMTM